MSNERRHQPEPIERAESRTRDRARSSMDLSAVLNAYRRYAPAYDMLFGPVFQWGRVATAARVNAVGRARVLEVGVGTGLSLSRYDPAQEIVGIDVSAEMLALASRRIEADGVRATARLANMDGERLAFRDAEFDVVVAMYVVSVTPDPRACLAEMQRVCKPGGAIFICNHFVEDGDRSLSVRLRSLSKWLGWRPDFSLLDLLEESEAEICSVEPLPPFGLFKLVTLRNP